MGKFQRSSLISRFLNDVLLHSNYAEGLRQDLRASPASGSCMLCLATYKSTTVLYNNPTTNVIPTVELGGVTLLPKIELQVAGVTHSVFVKSRFLAQRLTPDLSESSPLVPAYRGACALPS